MATVPSSFSPGGATVKVQRITLPGEKPFQPDPGWDYNPAANFATLKKAA